MLENVNLNVLGAAKAEPDVADGVPWNASTFSTKRHGASITDCDAEPVRTPGCIQAHGALLVLRLSDLSILQASDNTLAILGHPALDLLGRSVAVVVKAIGAAQLRSILTTEPTDRNPVYAFTLPQGEQVPALNVSLHTADGLVPVEFEPLEVRHADSSVSTLSFASRPVFAEADPHALLGAPTRPATPDPYAIIKKTVARLQSVSSSQQFCQVLADEVSRLSGMDRVMIYKFHPDFHGEVVAESLVGDLPPWLGQHYPAEDIPKPARDMFVKTWIRPVPYVNGALAEMTPLLNPDTGKPLDMTYCALRGVSMLYTEYLQNMGVNAGLTMSLRRGSELWGLINCHHYRGPCEVPYQLRASCEFLAQVGSLQLQAVEDRENSDYRLKLEDVNQQLLSLAAQEGGLASMTDGQPSLLGAMDASGAALYHRGRWWRVGETPNEAQLDALGAWLVQHLQTKSIEGPIYVTHKLSADYPPGAAFADVASGVLAAPLSSSGQSLVLWFRPEMIQTLHWGGNPDDKPMLPSPYGPRRMPRRSFERFTQAVSQQATP